MELGRKMKELVTKQSANRISAEIRDGFALLDLARGWLKQGNPIVAIELLKSATGSPEAEQHPELRAQIFKETGRAMMMQSDWKSAEPYYLGAERLFLNMSDLRGAAECARNRANMCFQQGLYQRSEDLCQKALEWIASLNDHQLRATVLNTLGAIKSATGDMRESIKTFRLCLADFEAAGNTIRQGYVLLNIGLSQTELGEHVEAVRTLSDSLAIALHEKDLHLVEICYQNISKCHLAQNETVLARSVLQTARKILPGLNSKALDTELCLLECRVQRMTGDVEGAESSLQTTYRVAVENDLAALQADVLFEQGLLYRDMGNRDMATCKFDSAARRYQELGVDRGFKDAVQALGQLKGNPNA
ncbi:MAG: tetratricopeptide repeat protein [bacterium]|nr:tetratricopeptide repeat protein [bacterium]